jgi:hypothetical protein
MNNMNQFFTEVASNNSRIFKTAALMEHKNDTLLREVIRLALDPFTQFYQRKIPAYTTNHTLGCNLQWGIDSLYELSSRSRTGNAAIDYLKFVLTALTADDAKVIERIIDKSLDCGIHTSTANAVWPGLIKEYPVMLCSPFEQRLVDKIKFPAMTQCKMDGMRFNAIVREGKCEFRSRNGKEIQLLGNLEQEFINLANGIDCVFDGELLVVRDGVILPRQEGNGILNKANKGTISVNDAAMVNATIWDICPYVYFTDGHCPTPYSTRFTTLQNMSLPSKIHLVEHNIVYDIEAAQTIFQKYLAAGQEGIILKDMNGPWEDKRSKGQLKFKAELDCDLRIVAVEEGTGKYTGMLGALVCTSSDGIVKVNVGSGFNDEQRKSLMSRDLLGKIVAVKYNARIKNRQGDESLFLPIFVEIREDKDVADTEALIK